MQALDIPRGHQNERMANSEKLMCFSFQETEEKLCYASLDRSSEGKRKKPKKQKSYLSDRNEDGQAPSLSKTTLVDGFSLESQTIEENIHDDPIRLFGLIRAQKKNVN